MSRAERLVHYLHVSKGWRGRRGSGEEKGSRGKGRREGERIESILIALAQSKPTWSGILQRRGKDKERRTDNF
jgi:hypothetical protein